MDKKIQQNKKKFIFRGEKGHLKAWYPASFTKYFSRAITFAPIRSLVSAFELYVSFIYSFVLNHKYYWVPFRSSFIDTVSNEICFTPIYVHELLAVVSSPLLPKRTTNGWGAQIWLHPPPLALEESFSLLTGVQSHLPYLWLFNFSQTTFYLRPIALASLCPGFSFSWITIILPSQVSACRSLSLKGHLSNFTLLTLPPSPSTFYYPSILAPMTLVHNTYYTFKGNGIFICQCPWLNKWTPWE